MVFYTENSTSVLVSLILTLQMKINKPEWPRSYSNTHIPQRTETMFHLLATQTTISTARNRLRIKIQINSRQVKGKPGNHQQSTMKH